MDKGLAKNVQQNAIENKSELAEKVQTEKELNTMTSSQQLLIQSIEEKDHQITELTSCKERNINSLNEKNTAIQTMRQQLGKFESTDEMLNEMKCENSRLNVI